MSDKAWKDSLGDIADDDFENLFEAISKINVLKSEKEKLQNRVRELEVRLFLEWVCPFCGNKEFDKESGDTYFCNNCKSMMFENETGGYETRKAHRIK